MRKKELEAVVMEQKVINRIFFIRRQKIKLDEDLAKMYEVETRSLMNR